MINIRFVLDLQHRRRPPFPKLRPPLLSEAGFPPKFQLSTFPQVFHPSNYKVSGLDFQVSCQFSTEVKRSGNNWDHKSETLAQNAILFTDRDVQNNQAWTIVTDDSNGRWYLFGSSSPHKLTLPWSTHSGWALNQGAINIDLKTRSAFIWGMVLMPEQLTEDLQLKMKISYYKLMGDSDYINPSKAFEDSTWDFTIASSDLDANGVYKFQDPDDSSKPMGFVASQIHVEKAAGPDRLNFDFVGTFYDFETAVDGKHSDNKTDRWNIYDVGAYLTLEDGSETTIDTTEYSVAKTTCLERCAPVAKTATKVYAGNKKISLSQFKCKCFTRDTEKIIGLPGSGFTGRTDPRFSFPCEPLYQPYEDRFNGDSGLIAFLGSKNTITTVTPGADAAGPTDESNICTSTSTADVAGMYMANLLDLDVASIVANYKYDTSKTRTFPKFNSSSGPSQTYVPASTDLVPFPGLDKAFWTILDQYTGNTEPNIRAGKGRMWCHYTGVGLYEHCKSQIALDTCAAITTWTLRNDRCKDIWKFFMQVCNRVRSLDPNNNNYKAYGSNAYNWCQSTQLAEQTPQVTFIANTTLFSFPGVPLFLVRKLDPGLSRAGGQNLRDVRQQPRPHRLARDPGRSRGFQQELSDPGNDDEIQMQHWLLSHRPDQSYSRTDLPGEQEGRLHKCEHVHT